MSTLKKLTFACKITLTAHMLRISRMFKQVAVTIKNSNRELDSSDIFIANMYTAPTASSVLSRAVDFLLCTNGSYTQHTWDVSIWYQKILNIELGKCINHKIETSKPKKTKLTEDDTEMLHVEIDRWISRRITTKRTIWNMYLTVFAHH